VALHGLYPLGVHHASAEHTPCLVGQCAHARAARIARIAKVCYTYTVAYDASA
jgi:hypothetical protein